MAICMKVLDKITTVSAKPSQIWKPCSRSEDIKSLLRCGAHTGRVYRTYGVLNGAWILPFKSGSALPKGAMLQYSELLFGSLEIVVNWKEPLNNSLPG